MKSKIQVTNRDLAKWFSKAMPLQGDAFRDKVDEYEKAIDQMPKVQRQALQCAFVFASKVPKGEREDMFQELALTLLEAKAQNVKLAYAIARADWIDFWRKLKVKSHYRIDSLDQIVNNHEGESYTLGELIIGEADFEAKLDGKADGQRLWASFPWHIRRIVQKRLLGHGLGKFERKELDAYAKANSHLLLS